MMSFATALPISVSYLSVKTCGGWVREKDRRLRRRTYRAGKKVGGLMLFIRRLRSAPTPVTFTP